MLNDDNYDIDVDALRHDMKEEAMGAFFIGGFGGALLEASDIDDMSDEGVIEKAKRDGIIRLFYFLDSGIINLSKCTAWLTILLSSFQTKWNLYLQLYFLHLRR